jgi:hypothetical protein
MIASIPLSVEIRATRKCGDSPPLQPFVSSAAAVHQEPSLGKQIERKNAKYKKYISAFSEANNLWPHARWRRRVAGQAWS